MTTTYTPTGQVQPVAGYTLPQDVIDLVVVETVNDPFVSGADNVAWLLGAFANIVSVKNFGALGDGIADDLAAILAAIAYLQSIGGGLLLFPVPVAFYRVTGTIAFTTDVALAGKARIDLDSPTADFLSISNGSGAAPGTSISGLFFRCAQVTSGRGISITGSGNKVFFSNCVLDFSNVRGESIWDDSWGPTILADSNLTSGKISSGQSLLSTGTGNFLVRGGSVTMAPGATDDMIASGGVVSLVDATLVHLSSTSSNVAFVTALATESVRIGDCLVDTDQASGSTSLVRIFNGAKVAAYGNDLSGRHGEQCPPFLIAGFAAQGSRIQGRPILATDEGTSTAITLGDGYEEIVVSCSSTTSPDITFPNAACPGQSLRFTYYNASVSTVQPTIANSPPVTGTLVPTVGSHEPLTGEFRWQSYDPATLPYRWVQIGTWGVGAPL